MSAANVFASNQCALPFIDIEEIFNMELLSNDEALEWFLERIEKQGISLYPAQEAAILELYEEKNVIQNTPTGSGKSLVASALHFKSLAQGKRSVYTCPIKALVNEKWLALCREFGPENVGLSTGDATVNRNAPILCCTAEILANIALKSGDDAGIEDGHYRRVPLLFGSRQRSRLANSFAYSHTIPLSTHVRHAGQYRFFRESANKVDRQTHDLNQND